MNKEKLAGIFERLIDLQIDMADILRRITETGLLKVKLELSIELGQHHRSQHNLYWNPDGVSQLIREYDDTLRRAREEYEACETELVELRSEVVGLVPA